MSLKAKVTRGKRSAPLLVVAYGPDGAGKTTLAASFPNVLFVGSERGTDFLDVARIDGCKKLDDLKETINDLLTEPHDFESFCIDSLDWLEPIVWKHCCDKHKWSSIEEPGYGKGYAEALTEWREIIRLVERLRTDRNMNIILLAHSQIKAFNDPNHELVYDRYMLKLNDKASALWREYVDNVFFLNFETIVGKDKNNKNKGKGRGDSEKRIVYTQRTPGYDAKNRAGLPSQIELPLEGGFSVIKGMLDEISSNGVDPDVLRSTIVGLISDYKDSETVSAVLSSVEVNKNNTAMLNKILARVQELVGA